MQSELLAKRVYDTAELCLKGEKPKFLGFLSDEEAKFAESILKNRNCKFEFYGGYESAQRVYLCCLPQWAEKVQYPIVPLTVSYRKTDQLTHRDFLGSLMALGLKRETVGDILIEEGRAVIFSSEETAEYILSQISKIGRVGVQLKRDAELPLPKCSVLKEFSETVSSERIDCVVSAVSNISRGKATEKIEQGLVTVNSVVCQKTTKQITDGDIISVRGCGKFIIDSIKDRTRKERLILKYKKYI